MNYPTISRRSFMTGSATLLASTLARTLPLKAAGNLRRFKLNCAESAQQILPDGAPETPVWAYNGRTPFQEFRIKQGDTFECEVVNHLPSATTVHWHGLRLPNEMDGVPNLTQAPIEPGQKFTYRFKAHDAGTYWFHSHMRGIEQIDRGLAGALIVEEDNPPEVHQDITWFLDDWRLSQDGEIVENFGAMHDVSHGGRIGNLSTVNGVFNGQTQIHAGERIRVRLINIANARIFKLSFGQLPYKVIAVDGQGVTPRTQEVFLGPGMRIDLIVQVPQDWSGREIAVVDRYRRDAAYRLRKLFVDDPQPMQRRLPSHTPPIAPNPITPIDLTRAVRHEILLTGGMMGSRVLQQMIAENTIAPEYGSVSLPGPWTLNGRPLAHGMQAPMLSLERGVTCILTIVNATAWYHPMHLHGYVFDILQRNGRADGTRADTVLLAPKERVDIAFLADNPGDWMFHCHILEHQIGGMMGYIRVK